MILGNNGLATEFACEIKTQTEDDEVEIDCQLYTLGYRVIDGDVGLPHNSFTTSDFMPHGESMHRPWTFIYKFSFSIKLL